MIYHTEQPRHEHQYAGLSHMVHADIWTILINARVPEALKLADEISAKVNGTFQVFDRNEPIKGKS